MKPDDWSNIAYIIAGFALAVQGAYVPAFGLIFLGITSYVAHVKGGDWWFYDWAGMYLAMVGIFLYNIGHPLYFWLVGLPIVLATLRYRFDSYTLTGAMWCAVVASAYLTGISVTIPVIIFAIALALRQLGEVRNYQFNHSAWHVLTAIGFYLLVP
jgi:hypothetical protein